MNAHLKQQITEANYVYYNNLIYVICDKSPNLYRLNLYECDITHKINKNNKEHIFFTNDNYSRPLRFLKIGTKNYKNAVFFPKLTKYLIYENNKYILSDIINTLETHDGTCQICYDIKPLTQSLYKCSHNNICIECSINWNTTWNNCPICRADNKIRDIMKTTLRNCDAIADVKNSCYLI